MRTFIDFNVSDKQEIDIKMLRVPINLYPGSEDSLDFLEKVSEELSDEAFYTSFRTVVDYKW